MKPNFIITLMILLYFMSRNYNSLVGSKIKAQWIQKWQYLVRIKLAQFPVTEEWGRWSAKRTCERASSRSITSAFIRLAQGMVDAIWLDLGALNQC